MTAKPITVTIKGEFMRDELAALLTLLQQPCDARHWEVFIDDPDGTIEQGEELLRGFPYVSTHRRN